MGQPVVKGALVECERCGVVRVPLPALVLRVGMHDGQAEVRYRCEGCGRIMLHPVAAEQASALACTDVRIEWWEPSPELDEHPRGDGFSETDVRAWADLLADDARLADAVAALAEPSA